MEPTIEKRIFVAYSETSKAYMIYIPSLRKVVVRRDVIFKEDKSFRRCHGSDSEVREKESHNIEVTPTLATIGAESSDGDEEE